MVKIVPKKLAPGVDICATSNVYYIIRSDLNCFMTTTNLNSGANIHIHSLHPSCRDGDHYMATQDYFYIIKGKDYRRVRNLETDEGGEVFYLHPHFRGGDYYFADSDIFYLVFQDRGMYRYVNDMSSFHHTGDYDIYPCCRHGLYYFGMNKHYYYVMSGDWGIEYHITANLGENWAPQMFSFDPSIVNFLPGGLGITQGPAFSTWKCIKTIANDSESPITWTEKITQKVGFEKEKISTIEKKWNVSSTASIEAGGFLSLIAQFQFSLSAEYGGSSVDTNQQTWTQATEIEETVNLTLEPKKKMYVWQYQLGLGEEPLLFCRDMKFEDNPNPPKDIPLPPAK